MAEEMELDDRELQVLKDKMDLLCAKLYDSCAQELEFFTRWKNQIYANCVREDAILTSLEESISNISKLVETRAIVCNLDESQVAGDAHEVFDEIPKLAHELDIMDEKDLEYEDAPQMLDEMLEETVPPVGVVLGFDAWTNTLSNGVNSSPCHYPSAIDLRDYIGGRLSWSCDLKSEALDTKSDEFATVRHQLEVWDDKLEGMAQPVDISAMYTTGSHVPRVIFVALGYTVTADIRTGNCRMRSQLELLISSREDAANNFVRGHYAVGREIVDLCIDRDEKQVENCIGMQGLLGFNAVGGDTGSGLVSLLLEHLFGDYGKQYKLTVTILLLFDALLPPMLPMMMWDHALDHPNYTSMLWLSKLGPSKEHQCAVESGFATIVDSISNEAFKLFCFVLRGRGGVIGIQVQNAYGKLTCHEHGVQPEGIISEDSSVGAARNEELTSLHSLSTCLDSLQAQCSPFISVNHVQGSEFATVRHRLEVWEGRLAAMVSLQIDGCNVTTIDDNHYPKTVQFLSTISGSNKQLSESVLRDLLNFSIVYWQSFSHPTEIRLSGQRLEWNKNTKEWDDQSISTVPDMTAKSPFSSIFVEKEKYFTYTLSVTNTITRFIIVVSYFFDCEYYGKQKHFTELRGLAIEKFVASGIVAFNVDTKQAQWTANLALRIDTEGFRAYIYSSPTVGDVEGDGHTDMVVQDGQEMKELTLVTTSLNGILYLIDGSAACADVDTDQALVGESISSLLQRLRDILEKFSSMGTIIDSLRPLEALGTNRAGFKDILKEMQEVYITVVVTISCAILVPFALEDSRHWHEEPNKLSDCEKKDVSAESREYSIPDDVVPNLYNVHLIKFFVPQDLLALDSETALQVVELDGLIEKVEGSAGVLTEHKYEIHKRLQARKYICGMTGDGVHAAPAQKKAEIGIAVVDTTNAASFNPSVIIKVYEGITAMMLVLVVNIQSFHVAYLGLKTAQFFHQVFLAHFDLEDKVKLDGWGIVTNHWRADPKASI